MVEWQQTFARVDDSHDAALVDPLLQQRSAARPPSRSMSPFTSQVIGHPSACGIVLNSQWQQKGCLARFGCHLFYVVIGGLKREELSYILYYLLLTRYSEMVGDIFGGNASIILYTSSYVYVYLVQFESSGNSGKCVPASPSLTSKSTIPPALLNSQNLPPTKELPGVPNGLSHQNDLLVNSFLLILIDTKWRTDVACCIPTVSY